MPNNIDLKDIHLPEVVAWFPFALGWWFLLIIAPLIIIFSVWFYRKITQKTATKAAKKILQAIKRNAEISDKEKLKQISILLRRIAISNNGRQQIASIIGIEWLEFLDGDLPNSPFRKGVGKVLLDAHYRTDVTIEIKPVIKLCEVWLEKNA